MKFAKPFQQLSVLTLFASLGSTTVHAHPGHIADETIHGLLHIEHMIPLVAAGAIAFAIYILRDK